MKLTREQIRARRKHVAPARTINMRRFSARAIALGRATSPEEIVDRPRTRGACIDGLRPCPYVACRHHLFLDVGAFGSIKLNFPDLEPGEMEESCVLDVAMRGPMRAEDVGVALNITRARANQIEARALANLARHLEAVET